MNGGFRKTILLMLLVSLLASTGLAEEQRTEMNRIDLTASMEVAKLSYDENPGDAMLQYAYAKLLYQLGDFFSAWDVMVPSMESAEAEPECLYLAGRLSYITGRYDTAETLFSMLLNDAIYAAQAMSGLELVYYQQNDFERLGRLEGEGSIHAQFAKAFGRNPYQVEWSGSEKVAKIPFLTADPLPVLTVHVNGKPANVLFDVGADAMFLDSELAESLGIQALTSMQGDIGKDAVDIGMGCADRLDLANATLTNVPVNIMPVRKFSQYFEDQGITIDGIIGTGTLRQFLPTIDYKNGQLVLRERTPKSGLALRAALGIYTEIPFSMDQTHFMQSRGQINGINGLNFFVDSGFVSGSGFTLPKETMDYLELDISQVDAPSTTFEVQTAGLADLTRKDVTGEYGSFPEGMHHGLGYILDGLISHQYLRKFSSWTIDFDAMQYVMGDSWQ